MESKDWSSWLLIGVAFVLALGVFVVLAVAMAPVGGYYGMMGGGTWGWGILMMAVLALILLAILVAVFGGLRGPAPTVVYPAYVPPDGTALEAVEQRYARGELSREDYLRIRGDLSHGSSQP